jgi:DNA-binding NarL/FixJ family response regulator
VGDAVVIETRRCYDFIVKNINNRDTITDVGEPPAELNELDEQALKLEKERVIDALLALNWQECLVLELWTTGKPLIEIASELSLSVPTVYQHLRTIQKRLLNSREDRTRSRLVKELPSSQSRLQAFDQLQKSVKLTPRKAGEWQTVINDARR